eukprot:TRINITY_DN7322_c0_g1_i3.p1 TRINITY_DN7322_c0_g1~~TRINITY_DN7322_c0_g1_i3.p1  ORF type:complete len:199 (-),score=18.32 TRINITY_DN7322_c0_g1_i3:1056-1652(-)
MVAAESSPGGQDDKRQAIGLGQLQEQVARLLEKRQVGKSELWLPTLGLGCSALGEVWDDIEPEAALATIREAHKLGVRLFDTAPWYGNGMSEARLGMGVNALRRRCSESSDVIHVTTKVGRTLNPEPKGTENKDGPWVGGFDLKVEYLGLPDSLLQKLAPNIALPACNWRSTLLSRHALRSSGWASQHSRAQLDCNGK